MFLSLFQNVINLKRLKGMVPKWIYIKLHGMAGLVYLSNVVVKCHWQKWKWIMSWGKVKVVEFAFHSSKSDYSLLIYRVQNLFFLIELTSRLQLIRFEITVLLITFCGETRETCLVTIIVFILNFVFFHFSISSQGKQKNLTMSSHVNSKGELKDK